MLIMVNYDRSNEGVLGKELHLCTMIAGLKLPTDPRWVNLAAMDIGAILTDHAYCEQKAASSCISIIQQFPDYEQVVKALAPIVTEEWGHFRMVLDELEKRNIPLGPQRKDEYVKALIAFLPKGGSRDARLIEKLLMAGLIEARSAERFRLLSKDISDEALRGFYKALMISETGHFRLFLDLALTIESREYVMGRWQAWLDHEAEVLQHLSPRGDRMH